MLSGLVSRALFVAAAAALLASCALAPTPSGERSKEYFSEKEYGKASPRVVAAGKPVPKGGGRYLIGEPYRVAGKTYIPAHDPTYSATGMASWYGSAFHGRLTANGEVYDVKGLTAAHPTMPLPSYARVTNLKNGRSVVVRVNDRGPFLHGRVIDVSQAVAEMLDFRQAGTAKVQVDYMGPAQMDGRDHKKLLASYDGPGKKPRRSLFGGPRQSGSFMVASAAPPPRDRPGRLPDDAFAPPPVAVSAPMVLMPVAVPAYGDDPLAPLIMRGGLMTSYAPSQPMSAAHQAAADLARADLRTALERAAEEKGRALSHDRRTPAVVQLGTFSDRANADRLARGFERFGRVEIVASESGDRTLHLVRLTVAASGDPQAVLALAAESGLADAFVLGN